MKITVTQEDIEEGSPNDPCGCPIALAIGRAIQRIPAVHHKCIIIRSKKYILPAEAQAFVHDFDNEVEVKPFEFEIPDLEP